MPTRQILRRLATASASPSSSSASASASVTAAAFAPPYAHSLTAPAAPSTAFRPPYAHSNAVASSSRQTLKAPLRFSLIPSTTPHDETRTQAFNTWARDLLATEQGRELIWRRWVESVIALEHAKSTGVSRSALVTRTC